MCIKKYQEGQYSYAVLLKEEYEELIKLMNNCVPVPWSSLKDYCINKGIKSIIQRKYDYFTGDDMEDQSGNLVININTNNKKLEIKLSPEEKEKISKTIKHRENILKKLKNIYGKIIWYNNRNDVIKAFHLVKNAERAIRLEGKKKRYLKKDFKKEKKIEKTKRKQAFFPEIEKTFPEIEKISNKLLSPKKKIDWGTLLQIVLLIMNIFFLSWNLGNEIQKQNENQKQNDKKQNSTDHFE